MRMTDGPYRFGPFSVFVATRELREGDALVDLPARAFDCLVYLIEHRDRAVGRDELIAAVWGRADVSEALLNHTILKIRRALGPNGQQAIRTVPRFGYRWVGEIEGPAMKARSVRTDADAIDAMQDGAPAAPSTTTDGATRTLRNPRAAWIAMGATAIALALLFFWIRTRAPDAPVMAPDETASSADAEAPAAMPALVLPAQIDAPDDWSWLRFGLMDLVANRLRSGALRTAPSESVVGMLKQRAAQDSDALLRDPALAGVAAMRVLPRVRLEGSRWKVVLDVAGAQYAMQVDAEADDPITAARTAADLLLRKLGRSPRVASPSDSSPELDDLLQRSGAAMLADQLEQARKLIERASPELRNAPAVQQRMAQIELRAGEYAAVEQRLAALLDRLSPQNDAALRARALITSASSHVRRNEFDKADEAYAEALALRSGVQDPEVLGIAYLGRGIVLAQKGRFDEASAELGRARIELETAGDPLGIAQVDVNLGDFQVLRHRPADALPMLHAAARRFEDLGAREGLVYSAIAIAAVERDLLDPVTALATTDRIWPAEAKTNNPRMQWMATRARAAALAANARLRDAQVLVDRIRSESDPQRDAVVRVQNEALAAQIAMARGDFAAAARIAETALQPALRESDKVLYARAGLALARAQRATGDATAAVATTRRLREWAASSGDDIAKLYATLAEAEQAWAEQKRDAALQAFASAMQEADRLAIPEERVAVAAPYIAALIEVGHIEEAQSISGRIAPWADRDLRAAWSKVLLFRALGRPDAEHTALATARRLAGDGVLPDSESTARPSGAP
jgi:DNA-binding winged helix-turn-helix (wHTH) protein/tetratricopeptide (TPR) repeat protein